MYQKGFAFLPLILIFFLLIGGFFIARYYLQDKNISFINTAENKSQSLSNNTTTNQNQILEKDTNNILYTIYQNDFHLLDSFKRISVNSQFSQISPYFDEDRG